MEHQTFLARYPTVANCSEGRHHDSRKDLLPVRVQRPGLRGRGVPAKRRDLGPGPRGPEADRQRPPSPYLRGLGRLLRAPRQTASHPIEVQPLAGHGHAEP